MYTRKGERVIDGSDHRQRFESDLFPSRYDTWCPDREIMPWLVVGEYQSSTDTPGESPFRTEVTPSRVLRSAADLEYAEVPAKVGETTSTRAPAARR